MVWRKNGKRKRTGRRKSGNVRRVVLNPIIFLLIL